MRRRDTALAVLVALIWGTNFVAIRTGIDSVPPFLFLAVRFVVVCVPAVFLVRRPGLPWLGLALGGAGLLTIAVGRGLSAPLLPLVVLVLAAVSWAVGNVLTRRAGALTGPGAGLGVTVWSGLVVPLPALALSFVFEGPTAIGAALRHLQWQAVASTAYTAYLSSLVGYGIWNTLLSRHPVAKVTPFAMLVPVFGMVAAAVAFHERPNAFELVGGLALLAGVGVAVIRPRGGVTAPAPAVPADASPVLAVDVEPAAAPAGEAAHLVQLAPTRGA